MGKKIFYFGWIPIIIVIIALKLFLMTNENTLAVQYIDTHKDIVGKSTNQYTFLRMYRVDNKVYIDVKLNNILINTAKDKKNISEQLFKVVKEGATCKDEETLDYLKKGIILQYEYYDKFKNKITSITIDRKFCK